MNKTRKIVLISGRSKAWTPRIVKDMMLTEGISDSEFVLYNIDLDAARLVKNYLENLAKGI